MFKKGDIIRYIALSPNSKSNLAYRFVTKDVVGDVVEFYHLDGFADEGVNDYKRYILVTSILREEEK